MESSTVEHSGLLSIQLDNTKHALNDRDSRVLVNEGDIGLVEDGSQVLLGDCQPHGVGDTLAQGTCYGDTQARTMHMCVTQYAWSANSLYMIHCTHMQQRPLLSRGEEAAQAEPGQTCSACTHQWGPSQKHSTGKIRGTLYTKSKTHFRPSQKHSSGQQSNRRHSWFSMLQ